MKSYMRMSACISGITLLLICLCSCSSREEKKSRAELESRGIPFEVNTLFDYIVKDDLEVVELFLKAGMDVDEHKMYEDVLKMESPPFTETPLIQASSLGNIRLVRLFIEHGANVNAQNGRMGGMTPLMYAAMAGHGEVAIYLLAKGADVEMYAFSPRVTALMIASDYGQINIVKILLDAGADINAQSFPSRRGMTGKTDKTALMYASDYHCIDFIYDGDQTKRQRSRDVAAIEQSAVIKLLVARGADVNKQTDNGWTALMVATKDACDYEYTEIVRTLLECGADRNLRAEDGSTALMQAEKKCNTYKELIALLKK
jgi:ankyrin repeat protein